ncbi:MAG TPA: hypothetical protein VN114_06435 [Oxalicibacterium sp.]|uniref:hypothetical protein n=1 Tax=Oxalicibacterium sp. TaxID=2766525 RepID=UPI002B50E929|nr:hypothetical protein [Oxalicibacterium sp.]HWU98132.1 hypothetical protein [Oxalicibacterium sp.]
MKLFKPLCAFGLLAVALTSSSAWADRYHSHVGVGVVIGGPVIGPGYWHPGYSPYYYPPYPYPYPPVVVAPSPPPVYIEQSQPAPDVQQQLQPQQQTNDWFYCRKPDGYYPYVKQCPGGWQRVPPQPPQR